MVDSRLLLVSGTYNDEQHLLYQLGFFITGAVKGWRHSKTITDTASDLDVVYYTDGSAPGSYDRLWVRLRANADNIVASSLSWFDPATNTGYDYIGNAVDSTELPTGTSSGIYWFAANKDVVHIVVDHLDGNIRHGGFGLLNSYYTRQEDPKPFFVFGQTAQGQKFSETRLHSYRPHSWGNSYGVSFSGIAASYKAEHPTQISFGSCNPRSQEPKLIEPVFYTDSVYGFYEVRGEVPGLYMCGGEGFNTGQLVTITGTLTTASGIYLWNKHDDVISWAIGPVTISGGG